MKAENKNIIFGLLILSALLLNSQTTTAQCHIDDWTALKALYESTDGDNWDDNTDWQQILENAPASNCDLSLLYGVGLDAQGRVNSLNLGGNRLIGSIPPELGNLSNLIWLYLFGNQLSGSIPPELGNLSNLIFLSMPGNQLSGSIPPELGNLSNLDRVWLYDNELIGNIPPELGNLSNLTFLRLDRNELFGRIPSELGNLSNLDLLEINDNNLSGCYSDNLAILCSQLTSSNFDGDADISVGNNFDAGWEDFCNNNEGVCVDDCTDDCDTDVYPGDLNNDGIVNNQDISLSGFFHSAVGPARTTEHQNINWYAHPSENWGVLNNQGIDIKHHDCNGDGVIDENDQQAIFENMDSIWKIPDSPPPSPTQSDYQVMLHPIDQIYDGYLVMNVALERRTSGDLIVQGGHFTIDYSDVEGEFSFVELDFLPITWLGVPTQNLWFETAHFPEDKKIEVGFTKNNDTNSTGSGVIAQLILQYSSLARQAGASDITYQFTVNTIGVHNNNGNFTPIEDQLLQVNLNSKCEPNWSIDEDTPFQNEYKSSSNITTNGFVLIGEDQEVEYKANRVRINTGFSAKAGADFKVRSSGCN